MKVEMPYRARLRNDRPFASQGFMHVDQGESGLANSSKKFDSGRFVLYFLFRQKLETR
jgi:hypothetical protein